MMATSWSTYFGHICDHASIFFGSEEISKTYKNPALKIDFGIDDLRHEVNAHAARRSEAEYEIRLYAGLIAALDRYCAKTLESHPQLFEGDSGRIADQSVLASYLMRLWIDFIIFHEWAHVINGHLEWANRANWDEVGDLAIGAPGIRQALELEADSRATVFVLATLAADWRAATEQLYGTPNPRHAWRNFFNALMLLFDFFEEIPGKKVVGGSTHPDPFARAYTCQMFIFGDHRRVAGLPVIEGADLQKYLTQLSIDYYLKAKGADPNRFLERSLAATQFCIGVDALIDQHGIKQFRLTREKDGVDPARASAGV